MYSSLVQLLDRPLLYERSTELFWNDPHISSQMLAAHLDPDTQAASRAPAFIERSAQWITSKCTLGKSLLDIGCGPGLYTKRFSEMGIHVQGIDISDRSIAYAKVHDNKTKYIVENYLEMDYCAEFDMITLIYCDYGALTPNERRELLSRVHKALKPGGLFIFDVFTPAHYANNHDTDTSWQIMKNGGFFSPLPHICLTAKYHYGESRWVDKYVVIEDNGCIRRFIIWDTAFSQHDLRDEVMAAGFTVDGIYGDAAGADVNLQSETLCMVAAR